MPKPKPVVPKNLKPYIFHGVDLQWTDGEDNATAECPWCGREGKFSVEIETGLWRCFVCNEGSGDDSDIRGGNSTTFLRKLVERGAEMTTDFSELAEDRRLLYPENLLLWDVCRSVTTGEWLVPAYSVKGSLAQVYRYVHAPDGRKLLGTPETEHQMFGVPLLAPDREVVYLCEGPWDAMALWETLRTTREDDDGEWLSTANPDRSLLADCNVLAVPGCGSVGKPLERWCELFAGRTVVLMFDNDHERTHPKTGKRVPPSGLSAMQRAAKILAGAKKPPDQLMYLRWGPKGWNPDLPHGMDVRDWLNESGMTRQDRLSSLLDMVEEVPSEWLGGKARRTGKKSKGGGQDLEPEKCTDYAQLSKSWRKALKWTDGLDCALSVMLASIVSTRSVGDQLWVKIVGPPACGKSTLCEAVSVNREYVLAKSTIRGFHSGYKTDKDGEEDNSLVVSVSGKTLVTKDGDTLLQSPNLGQILAEARDLYDSTSRTHYRNKTSRDYSGIRMTWILCGTSSLRSIDSSELGERFLDCVIMEGIDDAFEDDALMRIAKRSDQNTILQADGKADTHYNPDLRDAMCLTGGYVAHLRDNAEELLSQVDFPASSMRRCARLGKFVAYMRARPSGLQEETAEREFAARLVGQLVRLARCLAAVLNRRTVDEEVLRRVTKVAMDTSRGNTMEILRVVRSKPDGAAMSGVKQLVDLKDSKVQDLMYFLRRIGALQTFSRETKGVRSQIRWRLTSYMRELYDEVMG